MFLLFLKISKIRRLEKLAKRQEVADQKHLENCLESQVSAPQTPSIDPERNYNLSEPRFVYLYDTWMRYKNQIPEERKDYVENLLKKLSEKAEMYVTLFVILNL